MELWRIGVHNIDPNTGRRKPLGSIQPTGRIHTRSVSNQLCVLGESLSTAAKLVTDDSQRGSAVRYSGAQVVVWKRRVHQWRTDLMIRGDGRDLHLARYEGTMTRGDVKRLACEWLGRQTDT